METYKISYIRKYLDENNKTERKILEEYKNIAEDQELPITEIADNAYKFTSSLDERIRVINLLRTKHQLHRLRNSAINFNGVSMLIKSVEAVLKELNITLQEAKQQYKLSFVKKRDFYFITATDVYIEIQDVRDVFYNRKILQQVKNWINAIEWTQYKEVCEKYEVTKDLVLTSTDKELITGLMDYIEEVRSPMLQNNTMQINLTSVTLPFRVLNAWFREGTSKRIDPADTNRVIKLMQQVISKKLAVELPLNKNQNGLIVMKPKEKFTPYI